MSAHADPIGHGHGHDDHGAHPPTANVSSRVPASVLGMLLFIASGLMLFGSFFPVYFFDRVVNNAHPWPPAPYRFPKYVAGVNTALLTTSSFSIHWALQGIKRGNRTAMQAGLVVTLLLGLPFLLKQI